MFPLQARMNTFSLNRVVLVPVIQYDDEYDSDLSDDYAGPLANSDDDYYLDSSEADELEIETI